MGVPKILLVDDVMLLLQIQKSYLDLSAVDIHTAKNGEEALEIVRRERPDLVVLDVNMPKMDGVTCCAIIKQDPATRSIPVIMVSNAYRKEDIALCWKAGCDDFLQKPIEAKPFLEMAHKFLPAIERREPRVPCRIPVTCRIGNETFDAISEDISLHGIYLASAITVETGREIFLSFELPGLSTPVTAKGRISWLNGVERIRKQSFPIGFGVQTMEITGEGMVILRTNELKSFIERAKT
jgi:CheY-like chemotaxis protein